MCQIAINVMYQMMFSIACRRDHDYVKDIMGHLAPVRIIIHHRVSSISRFTDQCWVAQPRYIDPLPSSHSHHRQQNQCMYIYHTFNRRLRAIVQPTLSALSLVSYYNILVHHRDPYFPLYHSRSRDNDVSLARKVSILSKKYQF